MADIGMKGGDKLLAYIASISRALGEATRVQVGFLEGSTAGWNGPRPMKPRSSYANSTNFKRAKASYKALTVNGQINSQPAAYIASIMEYGDPAHNIPPRPFFSAMIKMNKNGWRTFLVKELRRLHYSSRPALESLGMLVVGQLQGSILQGDWAQLADATVRRKGFSTPLIDSHNMINAVDSVVS